MFLVKSSPKRQNMHFVAHYNHDKATANASSGPVPVSGDGAPGNSPCGGLVFGAVGDRGVPVYPGQSPDQVWAIAAIFKRDVDGMGHDEALALAREILRHITSANVVRD
jgi:hypothetical protein